MNRLRPFFFGLIAALLACAPSLTEARAPNSITLGIALEPPNLDPSATSAEATQDVVYANVYEGLTRIGEDGTVQPALATHWDVSADGLHYRFHLRSGVRFHDGSPFSALDVVFSLDRARRSGSTNPLHDLLAPIHSISAVDASTIDIDLSRPCASLLTILGWGNLVVMSPASASTAAIKPVGTGPFRFLTWRKGDAIVLGRNADYWGPAARLEQVTFRVIADPSAALAALQAGDVDGFSNFPAPEAIDALSKNPRLTVAIGSTEGETLLAINNARPPFNDVRVRRALAMAVDRHAVIAGAMNDFGTPIGSHFAPHNPDYVDLTGRYPHDIAAARALLAEAGVAEGQTFTLRLPPPTYARRSGEIIAAQLKAIGLSIRIENVEWAQWLDQVFTRHDYDLTIVSHTEPMDFDIYSRKNYYFGYHEPAYDALVQQLESTSDTKRRHALLVAIQRKIADDCVNVFLFELPKLGVWRRDLHGLWREAPIQAIDVTAAYLDASTPGAAETPRRPGGGNIVVTVGALLLGAVGFALRKHLSARLLVRRMTVLAGTLFAASALIFILTTLLPGDLATYMLGVHATPEALASLRESYGLDRSVVQQYGEWLYGLLRGDLGVSYTYHTPVADLLIERAAVSVPLAALALGGSTLIALLMALLGARFRNRWIDRSIGIATQLGVSIPGFWLGMLLISWLAIGHGLFPAGGFPGWSSGLTPALMALTLPALSLAIPQGCLLARILRTALDEALDSDYVRTARAKGVSAGGILVRHALPNSLLPTLTVLGMQFAFLLSGAIVVETVFGLPGLGRLLFQATAQRDLIVVRSVTVVIVAVIVLINFVVEALYGAADPRLRPERRA
jgi:peptide/nickel transport system substrate-binding protein